MTPAAPITSTIHPRRRLEDAGRDYHDHAGDSPAIGEQTTITRAISFTMRALSNLSDDGTLGFDQRDDMSRDLIEARTLARAAGADEAASRITYALASLGDDDLDEEAHEQVGRDLAEALRLLREAN